MMQARLVVKKIISFLFLTSFHCYVKRIFLTINFNRQVRSLEEEKSSCQDNIEKLSEQLSVDKEKITSLETTLCMQTKIGV